MIFPKPSSGKKRKIIASSESSAPRERQPGGGACAFYGFICQTIRDVDGKTQTRTGITDREESWPCGSAGWESFCAPSGL